MLENFLSPDAAYVTPYGVAHTIYLIFCVVSVTLFIKNKDFIIIHKKLFKKIFLIALAIQQVFFLYGWYALCTPNFWSEGLPLQLCRVASVLTIVFLITENKIVLNVLSYFSVYALISLFYPLSVYNFTHISGLSYMINHLITVLIPIFAVMILGWYINWKSFMHATIGFSIYFPLAVLANLIPGSNYFYLIERPFWNDMPSALYMFLAYTITVGAFAILTWFAIWMKDILAKSKTNVSSQLT